MSNRELISLIREYLSDVARFCGMFPVSNPLKEYRSGNLSKEGQLFSGSVSYSFHGVGCLFESADRLVDTDFGPGGRIDGFDLWRLRSYVASRPEKYHELCDGEDLEVAFESLVAEGVVSCPGWPPNPHLFYFNTAIALGPDCGIQDLQ